MPRKSNKSLFNFHAPQFTQISESHCGPAVIQMLLSSLGIEVSQEAVAEAGGAQELIELNGMRVDQLALAVHKLAHRVQFWYKDHAMLDDLVKLVASHHLPVGVEWQGLFEDPEDEDGDDSETGDVDYGHYSLVTHVNPRKNLLVIADPYKDYISQDRVFSYQEFEERWYDFNEVPDSQGGARLVEDYHMLFVVTPEGFDFPSELGMKRAF